MLLLVSELASNSVRHAHAPFVVQVVDVADGFVSVLLAQYLSALGFSPIQIGAIVTGTLLGSAAMTLGFGLGAKGLFEKGTLV